MKQDNDIQLLRGELTKEEEIQIQMAFIKAAMELFEKDKERGIVNLHGLDCLFTDIRILLNLLK